MAGIADFGICEPVAFYLDQNRPIAELPADPTKLPDKCIVLYRPESPKEDQAVHSLFSRFSVTEAKYYSARNSSWRTDLVVLEKRRP